MLEWLKNKQRVAEVDGITFYSEAALKRYLADKKKKESRKGLRMYTFVVPWGQEDVISVAVNALEIRGVFDYEIKRNGKFVDDLVGSFPETVIKYWSKDPLLAWKQTP